MTENRTVPKYSLARLFPLGFNEFWQKLEFKKDLELVIYSYVPATEEREEIKKTLASGGYGWGAYAIIKHFFDRYQYRTFEPHEDDFIAQFKSLCILAVSDIRKKEHLWTQVYKEIDKLLKPLKLVTDTRTSQNYDKTQQLGGQTVNKAKESLNRSEQKQTTSKNTPIFSNVDLTNSQFGGFSRQQQLATQTNEQGQSSSTGNRSHTSTKQNQINKEFYRSNKDANVVITKQDSYELSQAAARIINNFTLTLLDFPAYYKLFDKLWVKMFAPTVVPIIDEITGQRRWVSQAEYEELEAGETPKPKTPEGNEWDETLPYLERLKIYLNKIEKEWKKLPDTSNRKPRIALRLKIAEGAVKAYQKQYLDLPTPELFLQRIKGEIEGYTRVIGYENIIEIVVKYLKSYHFAKKYGTPSPAQLMIMLLGEPGLGKTYISEALAKALGRGYHLIGMNGKPHASLILGTNIENPGAEPGEVLKAIFRREDRASVIVFDEIEKALKEAKEAAGIPTDITVNQVFKDEFFDFPTPTNECIFISTVNRPQDVPGFVADRFAIKVEVLPLAYQQRLEVVRVVLQSELKKLAPALEKIYRKQWEEIYSLFDQEALLKQTLTWTFSIRGAKNNILLKLIPTLISDFLEPEQPLPADLVNYKWDFLQREGKDETCPYAKDVRNEHKQNCMCFIKNLHLAPNWKENMGEKYEF